MAGVQCSSPLVLEEGTVVVCVGRLVVFVSANGVVRGTVELEVSLDDSGPAPNLTLDGRLVVTSPLGDVVLVGHDGAVSLGAFGYDIVPPAVCPDGTLAIAGYAGSGLVRVDLNGAEVWSASFPHADLLPTVHRNGAVGCASLNDRETRFYDASGGLVGRCEGAASLAEASDEGWVALFGNAVAKLDATGAILWSLPFRDELKLRWGAIGPIVDRLGRVYYPHPHGVGCAYEGELLFQLELPSAPHDLALVAEGLVVVACDGALPAIE